MASNNKDNFYIGYLPEAPDKTAKFIKRVSIGLLFFILATALIFALSQKPFSSSIFEFGSSTTLEGTLITDPVPTLLVEKEGINQSVLLVGFGKFGAGRAIDQMEKEKGESLHGKKVKLEGTLIYNDGMTLLELTEEGQSLLAVEANPGFQSQKETPLGTLTLPGEIIDPKCYFGVMKPGQGKSHRSCAIRCISGGIPPMLKVQNQNGDSQYYLLLGENGEAINKEVLDYVAESITVEGVLSSWKDLNLLKIDPQKAIKRSL